MTLLERLRAGWPVRQSDPNSDLLREAADEIERLRAAGDVMFASLKANADEIERLRERVAELQAQWGYTESIQTVEIERLRAMLRDRPRDDGTVVAVGGEPGASTGKSE